MPTRIAIALVAVIGANGQSVINSSSGADGGLVLTTPGTVVFDPRSFKPPLNPASDNIYHFTNITIAAGVRVKLSGQVLGSPIIWLAQGPVTIDGVIDLNGDDGAYASRFPNGAGAGGHAGGAATHSGYGPGGGGAGGIFTGNQFLVPLVGGSGGAGNKTCGGGAGAGALLIASSASISVNGAILANGGSAVANCNGNGGSGGAIRLVAPIIDGFGQLSSKGGQPNGGDGVIRMESLDNRLAANVNNTPVSLGKPLGLFLPPTPPPSVRIVSIGGLPQTKPQITMNQPSNVAVMFETHNIPAGTIVALQCFGEDGTDHIANTNPITGTEELGQASALIDFPAGVSLCYAESRWTQPPLLPR